MFSLWNSALTVAVEDGDDEEEYEETTGSSQ